ncbi:MAG: hypothetical protein GX066_00615 [Clostridiaceae bacterium]|nr:hypothetical protein [Clostridiaceae bacterium]
MKPIDLQVMMPRTMDVSKVQNEFHQRNYAVQQNISHSLQQQAEQSTRRINSVDKSFEVKIREKNEERKRFQKEEQAGEGRKNNKEVKEIKKEKGKGSKKNHVIDIFI